MPAKQKRKERFMIKENLKAVEENILKACDASGRKREEVVLIAVSKTKPVSMLQEAYDLGIRDFGENKVQELVDKYEQLPKDIRWHMIGHLQTNKVKYIIDKAYLIHGVDSLHLAEEISRQAVKRGITANILIEVNIGSEESKFGCRAEEASMLIRDIAKLDGIYIKGLMAIAPFVENMQDNRKYFEQMAKLAVDITSELSDNTEYSMVDLKELSMGMTGDYPVAVEEGATYVRVGTGIFGHRDYSVKL